jgi:hypothetical protein
LNVTEHDAVPLDGSVQVDADSLPPDDVNFTEPDAEPAPVLTPLFVTVAVQVAAWPTDTGLGVQDTEVVVGCFHEMVTIAAAVVLDTVTPVEPLLM